MDLASLYNRQTPQAFFTINYRGVLTPQFFLEARYSQRRFSFVGSGAPTTDLIRGTLLIDRARGGRYWSPTFCGVCGNEQRDNDEEYIKGTYFLSTRNGGSHSIVAGYDLFNDKRLANNHQSGSDYRIIGTTAIIRNGVIYPQWNPGVSTVLQYNPIFVGSQGTNFRTHSLFFNDNWRFNSNLTFNLGLRWDKNNGKDAAGQLVVKDSAWSPRLGVVWDPTGTGVWSVTGSVGRYVAGIANSIADASAPGGRPANFQYVYSGPAINPDANAQTLVDSAAAIQQMFNWCNRDAQGLCRQPIAASSVPGVSVRVGDNLMSPNVIEYAAGISRQFGARATFRADYSYRSYRDFYASQIDTTTGVVTDPFGNRADLEVITNSNRLKRRYSGVTISGSYRINSRSEVGGNYTLSRLWGNFDGENTTSGPVTSTLLAYPEYKREEWFAPEGDLLADQRHRSGLWFLWGVPKLEGLTLSVLEDLGSGVPYGLAGTIDARSFVTNPGYATPQGGATTTYYYTARDAFRSEGARRTDVAALYNFNIPAGGRRVGVFVQAQVINLFDTQDMCACGGNVFQNGGAFASTRIQSTVQGPASGVGMTAFNPFTATPVEGVNFRYHPSFGTPLNRFAFTTPRMFRMNFGVRF
jgi:outer membrane receptor protein involved in Fe transport